MHIHVKVRGAADANSGTAGQNFRKQQMPAITINVQNKMSRGQRTEAFSALNAVDWVIERASSLENHRRTGQYFLGGLRHFCRKIFSTAPEKLLC